MATILELLADQLPPEGVPSHLVVVDVVVAVVVVGVGDHQGGDVEDAEQEGDQLERVHEAVAYTED